MRGDSGGRSAHRGSGRPVSELPLSVRARLLARDLVPPLAWRALKRGEVRITSRLAAWRIPPAPEAAPPPEIGRAGFEYAAEGWVAAWQAALDNRARSATTSVPLCDAGRQEPG